MRYIFGSLFILALMFGNSSCQKEFVIDDVDSSLITLPTVPGGVKGSFTANIRWFQILGRSDYSGIYYFRSNRDFRSF